MMICEDGDGSDDDDDDKDDEDDGGVGGDGGVDGDGGDGGCGCGDGGNGDGGGDGGDHYDALSPSLRSFSSMFSHLYEIILKPSKALHMPMMKGPGMADANTPRK